MPLQASHIKFALEIKDDLQVRDLGKYLTGAVYPDSRYFTKIDRSLTHGKDLIDKNFIGGDDFRKGWIAHLISDKAYYREVKPLFLGELNELEEKWLALNTAIKVIGDIRNAAEIEIGKYLPLIGAMGNPNSEDKELIEKHLAAMQKLYEHQDLRPEYYKTMFYEEKILSKLTKNIFKNVAELEQDKRKMSLINDLFDLKVIEGVRKDWLPKII